MLEECTRTSWLFGKGGSPFGSLLRWVEECLRKAGGIFGFLQRKTTGRVEIDGTDTKTSHNSTGVGATHS